MTLTLLSQVNSFLLSFLLGGAEELFKCIFWFSQCSCVASRRNNKAEQCVCHSYTKQIETFDFSANVSNYCQFVVDKKREKTKEERTKFIQRRGFLYRLSAQRPPQRSRVIGSRSQCFP